MPRNVHAVLLVLLVELLWVRIDSNGWGWKPLSEWEVSAFRVSAGFPIHAVSFIEHQTTGNMPPDTWLPEGHDWEPGLHVSPFSLTIDVLSAVALYFGIRWLLSFDAARTVSMGIVIGAAFGILTSLAARPPTRFQGQDPVTWLNGLWTFIALPVAICLLARHARSWREPLLLLAATVVMFPWASLWCDQFKPEYHHVLGERGRTVLGPSVELMVREPLMVGGMVLVVVFVLRRFVPGFRPREAAG
jgi:hypothetical protein